ncbi:MAG: hypothetical protein QGG48_10505, partial [Desulfatiglandales bacterium]|nr:hypothetical protein [Desulfatiglandales bacterium]
MRPKTFNNGKTHKYKSAKQSDGNYTIKDIPIFAAIGEAKGFTYNKKWLFKALKTFNLRAKNGYRYRVHIEHHNGDGSREGAGYFNNLHIKPCALDGKKVYAIYADLVDIKPDVYRRIREGELPYRSVEILNPEEPEISSLALMETETPFFRLPVTTVTEAMPSGAIFSFRTFKEVMSMQKEKKGALGLFQEELVEELEDYDDDEEEEVVEEEIMCDENDKDVKMMDEEKEDLVMSMLHKIMDLLKDHNGGGVEIIDEYEDETVPPLADPM